MEVLKKITNFVSKYMAVIVIAMAALALLAPNTVSFIKTSYVNTLLGIVMFGMGLTLKRVILKSYSAVQRTWSSAVSHSLR